MSNGILLFAHNNSQIDYSNMACITAKFAKKNLKVPVSLVTDSGTVRWMKETGIPAEETFDKIILTDDMSIKKIYTRRFYDGSLSFKKSDFKNNYRAWAYDLTPYENTLVIDVDFLIVNDQLSSIWDANCDFMINKVSFDLSPDRDNTEFIRVSDRGIDFFWATAFFFRKTEQNKVFFGLCQHIVENYNYYRFVYQIDSPMLRNDYVFSIALHMMGGFNNKLYPPPLPTNIYYCTDRDELYRVNNSKSFLFLIEKKDHLGEYVLAKTDNLNVHIMNKFSINRNSQALLGAINE
jgi:hypothetical protein